MAVIVNTEKIQQTPSFLSIISKYKTPSFSDSVAGHNHFPPVLTTVFEVLQKTQNKELEAPVYLPLAPSVFR